RLADRTVRIGPAPPAESYLSTDAVVAAAAAVGAEAIHPGYGFLSENPRLAHACDAASLVFIGPTAAQLETAGDKLAARAQGGAARGLPGAGGRGGRRRRGRGLPRPADRLAGPGQGGRGGRRAGPAARPHPGRAGLSSGAGNRRGTRRVR